MPDEDSAAADLALLTDEQRELATRETKPLWSALAEALREVEAAKTTHSTYFNMRELQEAIRWQTEVQIALGIRPGDRKGLAELQERAFPRLLLTEDVFARSGALFFGQERSNELFRLLVNNEEAKMIVEALSDLHTFYARDLLARPLKSPLESYKIKLKAELIKSILDRMIFLKQG